MAYEKDRFVGADTPDKPPHNLIGETILDSLAACFGGAVARGNKPGCRCL